MTRTTSACKQICTCVFNHEALMATVTKAPQQTDTYQAHLDTIFKEEVDDTGFKKSLKFLRRNILNLGEYCVFFVRHLYKHEWNKKKPDRTLEILKLVLDLLGAYPYAIEDGFDALITSVHTLSGFEDRGYMHEQISLAFMYIVEFCPLAKTYIINSISNNIPFITRPIPYIMNFYEFCFKLMEAVPSLSSHINYIVIKGLIRIDTELPREHLDEFLISSQNAANENISTDSNVLDIHSTHKNTWHEDFRKYDQLFSFCLSKFIERYNSTNDVILAYQNLRDSFLKQTLTSFGLIAVQYVWFYFCARDEEFLDLMMNDLWALFTDMNALIHVRHSAMIYMSGIITRGKFVPASTFTEYSLRICKWIVDYINKNNKLPEPHIASKSQGFSCHHLFNVACQSLFYVLVFLDQHSIFKSKSKWVKFILALDLEYIILSPLNPLYYCSDEIVDKLARMGITYQAFYAYNLINTNKRLKRLSSAFEKQEKDEEPINLTDLGNSCNFPFDPQLLPSVKTLLDSYYRHYSY